MPPPRKHRPSWHASYLDALRGWAVLGVVLVHVGVNCRLPHPWGDVAYSGQRGVQLFFLVSAFTLLWSSENRRKAEHQPTANFFLRRYLRLAPMYYLAILLAMLFDPVTAGSWRDRLLGVAFLQGFGPVAIFHAAAGAWTIADEALFYACLPLLTRWIRSFRSAVIALLAVTPVAGLLSLQLEHRYPADKLYFAFLWFPAELPVFLIGIATYFFWKEHLAPNVPAASARAKVASFTLLGAAAVIYLVNLPLDNRKLYFSSLGYALLLLALALHPWRLFVNNATILLGRISFSLYLLHFWVIAVVDHATSSFTSRLAPLPLFAVRFPLTLLFSALVAFFTWRFVEEPGIALGRRIIARREDRHARKMARTVSGPTNANPFCSSSAEEQF